MWETKIAENGGKKGKRRQMWDQVIAKILEKTVIALSLIHI